jgi:hypothetical protein
MRGNDIMDQRDDLLTTRLQHVQHIQFQADIVDIWTHGANRVAMYGKTFALTFTSNLNESFTTIPIVFTAGDTDANLKEFFLDVEHALEALPNGVIDNVDVNGDLRISDSAWTSAETTVANGAVDALYMNITFSGANVQGPQNLITVKHISCSDGCTPKLTGLDLKWDSMNVTEVVQADWNAYECGRRGKCDYSSGQCTCFSGYSGLACGTITSLV